MLNKSARRYFKYRLFFAVKSLLLFAVIVPVSIVCAEDGASAFDVYFTADGFAYSESKAVKSITGNWDGDLHTGDVTFSVDRAEAGVDWGKWRLGYIKRYDYYFEYSPDTAELVHKIKNKISLVPGEQYDLYLLANTLVADGLRLSYQQKRNAFSYDVSLSYLKGERFANGSLHGGAQALSDKDYDFNFDVDYFYSQDKLFDRVADVPDGDGYAVDIAFDWQMNERLKLGFRANDVVARMYWRDAPRTVAVATSDTKEYDQNGYVIYNPVISGVETNEDFVQTIPAKLYLSADYAIDKYSVDLAYRNYRIKSFYMVGVSTTAYNASSLGFSCNLTAASCGFAYSNAWFRFSFMTDKLQLQDARTLELSLSIEHAF